MYGAGDVRSPGMPPPLTQVGTPGLVPETIAAPAIQPQQEYDGVRFTALSKPQLLGKIIKGTIEKGHFLGALAKVAKIAAYYFLAAITGYQHTAVGKALIIKAAREQVKIYQDLPSVIYVKNKALSTSVVQPSYNIPQISDVLNKRDMTEAQTLAGKVNGELNRIGEESQKLRVRSESGGVPQVQPDHLDSGIHTGICFGTTLSLISAIHQGATEGGVGALTEERLVQIVQERQGVEGGLRPQGWTSEAAANQSVYQYMNDHFEIKEQPIPRGSVPRDAQTIKVVRRMLIDLPTDPLPSGGNPPFQHGTEGFQGLARDFIDKKYRSDMTLEQKVDNFITYRTPPIAENRKASVKEFLMGVGQLHEAMGTDGTCSASRIDECVENKMLAQFFKTFLSGQKEFEVCKTVAKARDIRISTKTDRYNLGASLALGSDAKFLEGMKHHLEVGTYELVIDTGSGGHSTALIVTENGIFWHDPNIGLVKCDSEHPEETILTALQTYREPDGSDQYKKQGEMFHNIRLMKYSSSQPSQRPQVIIRP